MQPNSDIEVPICNGLENSMNYDQPMQSLRVFAATWNVGGISPPSNLNLDDFLQVHDESDIYVLGFQEIVALNAGNVLVIEDNGTAAKWLSLISQSLNKSPSGYNSTKTNFPLETNSINTMIDSHFFQRTSLKAASKLFRADGRRRLKRCNCSIEQCQQYNILEDDFSSESRRRLERCKCSLETERKQSKDSCFKCRHSNILEDDFSSEEEDGPISEIIPQITTHATTNHMKYSLVKSKQMVGIFFTIWIRTELVQHIGHLRTTCVSRGIMGYLGNKGCISVSMSLYQTSFCFVCCHLASGEKEGDELRRNSDVIEILKHTQFPNICRSPIRRLPEKILEHDRVIWLGDLNYRIALSYSATRKYLEENDWDALLNNDQLKIEKEAGRVFEGWKEGKIYFGPTYKYSYNSDTYTGESIKSKDKRRNPAWCDRILCHGDGMQQLSYMRGESRFSDHRPVCATLLVDCLRIILDPACADLETKTVSPEQPLPDILFDAGHERT